MPGFFVDAYATLKRVTNTTSTVLGQHLPIQLDTINAEMLLELQDIPADSYSLYSFMWTTPLPQRNDYFIDENTGIAYQVFGVVKAYLAYFECAVTRYQGVVP